MAAVWTKGTGGQETEGPSYRKTMERKKNVYTQKKIKQESGA